MNKPMMAAMLALTHATYDAIVAAVDFAIPIAEIFAGITTNISWDDSAVKFVKTARANEVLMKWIHDLVCEHPDIVNTTGDERTAAIYAAMETTAPAGGAIRDILTKIGLTWEQVKEYIPTLIALLLTVLGARR